MTTFLRAADRADALLLHLLRQDWDPRAPVSVAGWTEADWSSVIESALAHGVAGLVCRSIASHPESLAPPDIRAAASSYLARASEQGRVQVACLFDVFDALDAAAVPALAFKGPALGQIAYGSATIRPSRDLDVLVHRA
ncbi:MAG: nucleotidyltransferase family protein, partial [Burkholderiales bacterium]|nr:nucleotidyltransferase family protein [Burkholderiales bacterium]